MKELELVINVQNGDMEAFEELFNLYKHKALWTVYSITKDKNLSEDIIQEAFVVCYTSIKSLKKPEYFKTWFYRILTRTAWRYTKKQGKLIAVEEIYRESDDINENTPLNKLEQKEFRQLIYQEIQKLKPKLQTTIILYYYNEFSVKEISEIMGCFEGTVKSRLYTGRCRLKESLKELEKDYT